MSEPSGSSPPEKSESTRSTTPPQVFICYSRKDSEFLEPLKRSLDHLVQDGRIKLWYDRQEIRTGQDWQGKIKEAIANSRAAVLLVSRNFFKSPVIRYVELPDLLEAKKEGRLEVMPVIVGKCSYGMTHLADFDMVDLLSEPDQDRAWQKLAADIEKALGVGGCRTNPGPISGAERPGSGGTATVPVPGPVDTGRAKASGITERGKWTSLACPLIALFGGSCASLTWDYTHTEFFPWIGFGIPALSTLGFWGIVALGRWLTPSLKRRSICAQSWGTWHLLLLVLGRYRGTTAIAILALLWLSLGSFVGTVEFRGPAGEMVSLDGQPLELTGRPSRRIYWTAPFAPRTILVEKSGAFAARIDVWPWRRTAFSARPSFLLVPDQVIAQLFSRESRSTAIEVSIAQDGSPQAFGSKRYHGNAIWISDMRFNDSVRRLIRDLIAKESYPNGQVKWLLDPVLPQSGTLELGPDPDLDVTMLQVGSDPGWIRLSVQGDERYVIRDGEGVRPVRVSWLSLPQSEESR